MAAFFSATPRSARKTSPDRSRIASLPVLTRPFTSRAMLAPSTATLSPLSMRFALPVSISSVCSPRKTRRKNRLLLRHPRIERRMVCLLRSFADSLGPRRIPPGAVSWPAEMLYSGPQETRYGDGCRRKIWRIDGHAQRGPADRHSAGANHYFHGHHAAYSQGPGYARSSALAEPAAERRAREQNSGRPDCHERQT